MGKAAKLQYPLYTPFDSCTCEGWIRRSLPEWIGFTSTLAKATLHFTRAPTCEVLVTKEQDQT